MHDASGQVKQPPRQSDQKGGSGAARPVRPFFRYYIHDGISACRLQLIGELTESEVGELSGCWRTARTILESRKLILDLHALRAVDEAGKRWLAAMAEQEGATCLPEQFLRDLVAGKHTGAIETAARTPKPGLFGRLLAFLRGADVETAK